MYDSHNNDTHRSAFSRRGHGPYGCGDYEAPRMYYGLIFSLYLLYLLITAVITAAAFDERRAIHGRVAFVYREQYYNLSIAVVFFKFGCSINISVRK